MIRKKVKNNELISKFELDNVRILKQNFYLEVKKKISNCFSTFRKSKNTIIR